jgi:Arc/MetJ-type ribon-helix-helix transcriptional regulator
MLDYRKRMNVVLPPNLDNYVAELVQTSGYKGPDEVVLEALREHQSRRQGTEIVTTAELEHLLDEGLENLDRVKSVGEIVPR